MKKSKIKLTLIDDYIKLVTFGNFFMSYKDANIDSNMVALNRAVKMAYDTIFEKLKMNNVSLILLKQQLNQNSELFNLTKTETIEKLLTKIYSNINQIADSLSNKMEQLKVKDIKLAL